MQKATFYLVAAVFAFIGIAYLIAEFGCIAGIFYKIMSPGGCPSADKIAEGFAALLAAALAYAAGQSSNKENKP